MINIKDWQKVSLGGRSECFDGVKIGINRITFTSLLIQNNGLKDYDYCRVIVKEDRLGFVFHKDKVSNALKLTKASKCDSKSMFSRKIKAEFNLMNGNFEYEFESTQTKDPIIIIVIKHED